MKKFYNLEPCSDWGDAQTELCLCLSPMTYCRKLHDVVYLLKLNFSMSSLVRDRAWFVHLYGEIIPELKLGD